MADRLRRTREAFGLNQASWCRLVGIEVQAWNNYESGLRRISVDQAIKVCQATGVTTDWIYRGLMSAGLPMNIQVALQSGQHNGPKRR
jgi:transcriptional regulator with XRE-family HTH domain